MIVLARRIDNVMKAMREAKDYDVKMIWNDKLQALFKLKKKNSYERLEDQSRMVD